MSISRTDILTTIRAAIEPLGYVCAMWEADEKFLQREIHGEPVVHFDRSGVTAAPAFDRHGHDAKIRSRIETLRSTFDLFQPLTIKELNRGNSIEAITYYHGMTLRPLVEILRILHAPARYNFHTRYLYYEPPGNILAQIEPLFFPRDADELLRHHTRAGQIFHEAMADLQRIEGDGGEDSEKGMVR